MIRLQVPEGQDLQLISLGARTLPRREYQGLGTIGHAVVAHPLSGSKTLRNCFL